MFRKAVVCADTGSSVEDGTRCTQSVQLKDNIALCNGKQMSLRYIRYSDNHA